MDRPGSSGPTRPENGRSTSPLRFGPYRKGTSNRAARSSIGGLRPGRFPSAAPNSAGDFQQPASRGAPPTPSTTGQRRQTGAGGPGRGPQSRPVDSSPDSNRAVPGNPEQGK